MSDFSIADSMPETTLCELRVEGAVGHLTLRREQVFNALDPQLIDEVCELLDWSSERSAAERGELEDLAGERLLRVFVF